MGGAASYDLMISCSRYGIDGSVDVILHAFTDEKTGDVSHE